MFQKNWSVISLLWLLRGAESVVWTLIPATLVFAIDFGGIWYGAAIGCILSAGGVTASRLAFDTRVYAELARQRAMHLVAVDKDSARAKLQRFRQELLFLESGVPTALQGVVDLAVGLLFIISQTAVGAGLLVLAILPCAVISRYVMAVIARIGEEKNALARQEAEIYATGDGAKFSYYFHATKALEVRESDADAIAFGVNTTLARLAVLGAVALAVTGGVTAAAAVTVYYYGDRVSNSIDRFTTAAQRWAAAKAAAQV